MTTSDITKKYKQLQEKLECIENQLYKRKVYDSVQGSSGAPAYSKVTKKVEGYIHGEGSINLIAAQKDVKRQIAEIDIFIAGIPITEYRRALEMLCYEGFKTWEEVGDAMQTDGDNLRRNINNYLKKLDCEK